MFYISDVLYFALFLALTIFAARAVWRRTSSWSRLEVWALVSGVTVGFSGILIWILGSTIGVGKSLALCLLVVPIACFWWASRTPKNSESSTRSVVERASWKNLWRELALDEKLLALYTILVCGLTFLLSLAPPNGADYDSLVYHLAAPAQYIREGRIVELPYDHHTYFAFGLEMLFMVGLLWSGPVLAKLFHWLMLPIICATLIGSGTRFVSRRAGLASAAIWCSLPLVQLEASTAYIDLGLVAFTLLAIVCFWRWRLAFLESNSATSSTRSAHYLLLAGALCGFCLGTKYLGVLTMFWVLVATFFVMARARRFEAKTVSAFVALALFIGGGWYARNFYWTGNPVYPFAYSVFGGEGWTAEMAQRYNVEQQIYGFGKTFADWFLLPWRASMTPLNLGVDTNSNSLVGQPFWPLIPGFGDRNYTGTFEVPGLIFSTFIGPFLLALGVPSLFIKRKPQWVRFAGWTALFFGAFWAVSSQMIRYSLPLFPFVCVCCGWAYANYQARSTILRATNALAIALWLVWSTAFHIHSSSSVWPVVLGKETPQRHLSRFVPPFTAMQWINENLPPTVVVAIYGEPRAFYLERKYFWADSYQNTLFTQAESNAVSLIRALKANGATHILWNTQPTKNFGVGGPSPALQAAITSGQVRLATEPIRGYTILEIL